MHIYFAITTHAHTRPQCIATHVRALSTHTLFIACLSSLIQIWILIRSCDTFHRGRFAFPCSCVCRHSLDPLNGIYRTGVTVTRGSFVDQGTHEVKGHLFDVTMRRGCFYEIVRICFFFVSWRSTACLHLFWKGVWRNSVVQLAMVTTKFLARGTLSFCFQYIVLVIFFFYCYLSKWLWEHSSMTSEMSFLSYLTSLPQPLRMISPRFCGLQRTYSRPSPTPTCALTVSRWGTAVMMGNDITPVGVERQGSGEVQVEAKERFGEREARGEPERV